MSAAKLKLPKIEKGATYYHVLLWTDTLSNPIDLTDCTAALHVRPEVTSDTLLLECTTENNRLIITPLEGKIEISITDEDTMLLVSDGGEYDLEIYHPDGKTTRLIKGYWEFSDEVTRL